MKVMLTRFQRLPLYLLSALSLTACEVELAHSHLQNADNTWHFRWAGDILESRPIFWSGCDANRIFPDLLFAVMARSLPQSEHYFTWLTYFTGIPTITLCASLYILAVQLYDDGKERLFFFASFTAAFAGITAI